MDCSKNKDFNYWFTGLIEGNGSLLLNKKNNSVSCEIILRSKDIQTLYKIKKQLGGGNINKRSKIDAYRYRITKNNIIIDIINRINGKLITSSKHIQFITIANFFNIIQGCETVFYS